MIIVKSKSVIRKLKKSRRPDRSFKRNVRVVLPLMRKALIKLLL